MKKDSRSLEQVLRIDGNGSFCEIMLSGLGIDKVLINFKQYDKTAAKGQRTKGDVAIWLDIHDAQVLAHDILSGRIAKLGKAAKAEAEAAGQKYPRSVYDNQGGTSASRSATGTATARVFSISPGASQPWVLCAKQGQAHETPEGLIVMDGIPAVAVRVPATDAALKKFALAMETAVRVWERLRFDPVVTPMMQEALSRRREAIEQAKNDCA